MLRVVCILLLLSCLYNAYEKAVHYIDVMERTIIEYEIADEERSELYD